MAMTTVRRPPPARAADPPAATRKVKTSISLAAGLLHAIDALAGKSSRSAWIEGSVRASVERALRRRRDENDLRLLNQHAHTLNRESADAAAYQTAWSLD